MERMDMGRPRKNWKDSASGKGMKAYSLKLMMMVMMIYHHHCSSRTNSSLIHDHILLEDSANV
jgi:hypothetical protein